MSLPTRRSRLATILIRGRLHVQCLQERRCEGRDVQPIVPLLEQEGVERSTFVRYQARASDSRRK